MSHGVIPIDKVFDPRRFEERWYEHWQRLGVFTANPDSPRPPFVMVIPPPNVTGRLHMGHALNNTLQDILARWRRMSGDDVLWLPGTDHAGIATQMVVDRELRKEGLSRESLGREAFVARVWKWKEEYGGAIITQLKRLGCSCDWSRERFTMEPALSRAVREAFVRLHDQGLIYRDQFIVNWCPHCRTAISDLEVVPQAVRGRLYTILYPFEGDGAGIEVATTRPETMLGDTGVAVHPEDGRYRHLIGRTVLLPLVGRALPVIADLIVEREFGTGAVKVTPAHDPNDFDIARRAGLPTLLVMDEIGRMNDNVPEPYRGLDRFEARSRVIEDLRRTGLLKEVREHPHNVGHCQRCGTIVEPLLSTQWFVRVGPLAEEATRAVASDRVGFTPAHWINSYNEWMGKIHDWCISRQLWWGHPIPAWHCDACGKVLVGREAPTACSACGGALREDPDVLDTWFSSALWPFSTLGWPGASRELDRYYPTSALVTGFDILFFWVARMLMMGLRLMGDVPFRRVYITGLVRDAEGQKMSKTRGNVVDPLELVDRYGADSLRFTLAAMATPGADLPLSLERMEGYRAFANKLWNAARFVLLGAGESGTDAGAPATLPPRPELALQDRWILSRLTRLVDEVDRSLQQFRFDEVANALYQFLWHEYCDWYLEMCKPALLPGADPAAARSARMVLISVLETVLRLLHPVMPFLTEEIWQRLPHEGPTIATAPYPRADLSLLDENAERQMSILTETVGKVRSLRAGLNLDPRHRVRLLYRTHTAEAAATLAEQHPLLLSLARLSAAEEVDSFEAAGPAARAVTAGADLALPLADLIDLDAERRRLTREIEKLTREREGHAQKLRNADFVNRARPEIVDKVRGIDRELTEKIERLRSTLQGLEAPS